MLCNVVWNTAFALHDDLCDNAWFSLLWNGYFIQYHSITHFQLPVKLIKISVWYPHNIHHESSYLSTQWWIYWFVSSLLSIFIQEIHSFALQFDAFNFIQCNPMQSNAMNCPCNYNTQLSNNGSWIDIIGIICIIIGICHRTVHVLLSLSFIIIQFYFVVVVNVSNMFFWFIIFYH
jgi:hypothetical protein